MDIVALDHNQIAEFCRRWQVAELAVFGSAARGDSRPDSDIDILVTFSPGARIGLIAFSKMQIELSGLLDREVDLVTRSGLKPRLRDAVLAEARVLYAA